jgi:hypothetical protein
LGTSGRARYSAGNRAELSVKKMKGTPRPSSILDSGNTVSPPKATSSSARSTVIVRSTLSASATDLSGPSTA